MQIYHLFTDRFSNGWGGEWLIHARDLDHARELVAACPAPANVDYAGPHRDKDTMLKLLSGAPAQAHDTSGYEVFDAQAGLIVGIETGGDPAEFQLVRVSAAIAVPPTPNPQPQIPNILIPQS